LLFADIAKETDMAKGNLYYYFKNKEAILDRVAINRVEHIPKNAKNIGDELLESKYI
jgi:AcrR family transcriptional regulator